MYEAARVGDTIYHTSAFWGFLAGAVLGLALCALMIFVPCGFLVGLLIGAVASQLPEIGKQLGQNKKSPAGTIKTGSHNVHINNRAAAYSGIIMDDYKGEGSFVACDDHPKSPPPQVAEGSQIVFVTGRPAARKDDKTECDAGINEGSDNVHIGLEKQTYLPIDPEVPKWMETTVQILMAVVGIAGAVRGIAKLGLSGLKAIAPCAGKMIGGFVTGMVAGNLMDRAVASAVSGLFGNPVNAITGQKILLAEDEIDFTLPDMMPILWYRHYSSDLDHNSILGKGWILPWEQTLHQEGEIIYLTDNQGRKVPFPAIKAGERIYSPSENIFLICTESGHYVIQTLVDNELYYFGELFDGQATKLQRIENALGHYIHFNYERDQLTDILSTGGHRLHLHYKHPKGRLTEVVRVVDCKPVETMVSYRYDAQGQLTNVIDRNGETTRYFSYDNNGLMVSHQNGLGFKCEYRWQTINNQPRVVEHWTNDGEYYCFDYDTDTNKTTITDALKRQAEIHYTDEHITTYYKDFGGDEYNLTLDENNNVTELKIGNTQSFKLKYDELARLIEETDPLGRTVQYVYHKETSLFAEVIQPDGSKWQNRYDEQGVLLAEIDPLGNQTQYHNTEDGLPYAIVDALEKRKTIIWNKLAQVIRYTDCSEKSTSYEYDQNYNLSSITNALGQTTILERKPQGEITAIIHPDGVKETFTYNAMGQLLSHADGKGQTRYLSRNPRGLLIRRFDPKDQTISYQYDVAQRLTTLLNENNEAYRFNYDEHDRLIQETRIDQLQRHYHYDAEGYLTRLTEQTISKDLKDTERTILFKRDKLGRLIEKQTDDALYQYQYDLMDRLLKIDRKPTLIGKELGITKETLTFAYDANGQLIQETTPTSELNYAYDELGNLTSLTLPNQRQLNYQYYGSGHLHQISLDQMIISDFERDDLHREILRTQGQLTSRFGYDAQGRKHWQYATHKPLNEVTTLNKQQLPIDRQLKSRDNALFRQYQYDPAGELNAMLDKARGKTEYQYNENGQLQSITQPTNQQHFTNDAAGNFLPGQILPNKHFALHNRITDYGDIHLSYDEWGNVKEKAIGLNKYQRFSYDCENRLIKAQTYENDKLTQEGKYYYDSLGRRIKKESTHIITNQTKQTTFLWQGLRLLQEQSEQKQQTYIYETGNYAPLARIDTEYEVDDIYYYHTDQIGTPLELTNEQGTIVWQANYKAWGEVDSFSINKIEQNLRYQGQYFDEETELHYNTFRYYDPQVGRFTTQDPIGLFGGFNLYAYAPNPTVWIDPLGLCPVWDSKVNRFRNSQNGRFISRSDAANQLNIGSQKQAGHIAGTPQYTNRVRQGKPTSAFDNAQDAERYVRETIERGRPVPNQPGKFDLDYGSRTGAGPNGGAQTRVRVHVDSKGNAHGHPSGPEI